MSYHFYPSHPPTATHPSYPSHPVYRPSPTQVNSYAPPSHPPPGYPSFDFLEGFGYPTPGGGRGGFGGRGGRGGRRGEFVHRHGYESGHGHGYRRGGRDEYYQSDSPSSSSDSEDEPAGHRTSDDLTDREARMIAELERIRAIRVARAGEGAPRHHHRREVRGSETEGPHHHHHPSRHHEVREEHRQNRESHRHERDSHRHARDARQSDREARRSHHHHHHPTPPAPAPVPAPRTQPEVSFALPTTLPPTPVYPVCGTAALHAARSRAQQQPQVCPAWMGPAPTPAPAPVPAPAAPAAVPAAPAQTRPHPPTFGPFGFPLPHPPRGPHQLPPFGGRGPHGHPFGPFGAGGPGGWGSFAAPPSAPPPPQQQQQQGRRGQEFWTGLMNQFAENLAGHVPAAPTTTTAAAPAAAATTTAPTPVPQTLDSQIRAIRASAAARGAEVAQQEKEEKEARKREEEMNELERSIMDSFGPQMMFEFRDPEEEKLPTAVAAPRTATPPSAATAPTATAEPTHTESELASIFSALLGPQLGSSVSSLVDAGRAGGKVDLENLVGLVSDLVLSTKGEEGKGKGKATEKDGEGEEERKELEGLGRVIEHFLPGLGGVGEVLAERFGRKPEVQEKQPVKREEKVGVAGPSGLKVEEKVEKGKAKEVVEHTPTYIRFVGPFERCARSGAPSPSPARAATPTAPTPRAPAAAPAPTAEIDETDRLQAQYRSRLNRSHRLAKLSTLQRKLADATATFTFPSTLEFSGPSSPTLSATDSDTPKTDDATHRTPSLTFSPHNQAYHAHAHALLQLLTAADGVESDGDEEVRRRRKEFVRDVEGRLEEMEAKRVEIWEAQEREVRKGMEVEETAPAAASPVAVPAAVEVEGYAVEEPAAEAVVEKNEEVATEENAAPTVTTTEELQATTESTPSAAVEPAPSTPAETVTPVPTEPAAATTEEAIPAPVAVTRIDTRNNDSDAESTVSLPETTSTEEKRKSWKPTVEDDEEDFTLV